MKECVFEFGKQPLKQWIRENRDCERMKLVGNVKSNLMDDEYYFPVKGDEGCRQLYHELGNDNPFDLLYGFDKLAKDFHPKEFDLSEMRLLDIEDEDGNDDMPWGWGSDLLEDNPSMFLRMLCNRIYGTEFVVKDGFILTKDGRTVVHCFNPKGVVNIPQGVERIGRIAFSNIEKGKLEVVLPEGVVSIGMSAFDNCEALKRVNLPESLRELGISAFENTELKEVSIPDAIEEIPDRCFSFTYIEKLKLPRNLKAVRTEAFVGLSPKKIFFPEGLETLEWGCFDSHEQIIMYMPKTVKEIAEDFYYDSYVEDHPSDHRPYIYMDPANPYFESKRGRLYRKGGRKPYI
jgi:hypothetical protein